MKKDLDKLLSRTLFTYFIILFVIFILKMFGLDYFGLDMNNKIINSINNFVSILSFIFSLLYKKQKERCKNKL